LGRGAAAGTATAIIALALMAAGALAVVSDEAAAQLIPAAVPPAAIGANGAVPGPTSLPTGSSEIRSRIESAAGLVVAGRRLRGALLRRFYAAYDFAPVWEARRPQAEALLRAVQRADEHGIDPDLFHAAALGQTAALPPIERDLLLSDAFLAYADALARGAVPIENRLDDEDLTPEPVDVVAALQQALGQPDPAAAIEALAPRLPAYRALRQALQSQRATAAGDANEHRRRDIEVNLERLRWLPRQLPADRVWVNTANAQLVLYRDDRPIFTTRVVVGQTDWQTPELRTTIDSLLFNPPWNVPYSIATKEILPKVARDPDYLSKHRMVMRPNGGIQQLPGAGTALGLLKFEMTNRFDVYLHDTPLKAFFNRDNRRQSHGCIRVQNPRDLGALLLQQPVEVINKAIAQGATSRRSLPAPMPVFVVYQTAFLDADGMLIFSPDVYDRDDEIWRQLNPGRQAPVAQHEPGSQRRG
jgi:murein L,D-transpeptidase YcbB/YkuD